METSASKTVLNGNLSEDFRSIENCWHMCKYIRITNMCVCVCECVSACVVFFRMSFKMDELPFREVFI